MRRLLAAGVAVYAITVLAIATFAAFVPTPSPDALRRTDIIVGLGGGMDTDGTLHPSSRKRVERTVELWRAGLAPRLHFSGGRGRENGPSAGERMADLAVSLGVPAAVISYEDRSQSTLQNALFSAPQLHDATSIRLVTEGFHLPRSWLSFRWAGDWSLSLTPSERFRSVSPNSRYPGLTMVLREGVAFWFNAGRVLTYEAGGLIGVDQRTREGWLY